MKILFLLLIVIPFSVFTQIWVKSNAVWYYKYTDRTTTLLFGYLKVEHVKDSTINGISCKVLVTTKFDFAEDQIGEVHLIGESIVDTNYTYANSDTVFYWKNNQFELLYDFSKTSGESWIINTSNSSSSACVNPSITYVNNAFAQNFSGNQLQVMELNSPNNSHWKMMGVCNSHFGNHSVNYLQYHFLFPVESSCDVTIPDESPLYDFICFKDDELTYSPDNGACGNILSLLENRKNEQFQIYPKPSTSGQISVKTTRSEEYVLEVMNLLGESVYSKKQFFAANTSSLIQLSIPSGMYVLNIISKEDKVIHSEKLSVLN